MRAHDTDPWWLIAGLDLVGFEDPEEGEETEEEEEESEEEDEGEEEEDELASLADLTVRDLGILEDLDEDERAELAKLIAEEDPEAKRTAGLKSALRKERAERKRLERELRKLGKKPVKKVAKKAETATEGDEEDETSEAAQAAEARAEKLGTKLLKNAVDTAILKHGSDFKSSDELLALVDRKEIDVDQDDDDPSEIEVDEESVRDAVKALAKKSPHLLKSKDARKVGSGSKLGGRSKKSKEPSEEELRKKYPGLRR